MALLIDNSEVFEVLKYHYQGAIRLGKRYPSCPHKGGYENACVKNERVYRQYDTVAVIYK